MSSRDDRRRRERSWERDDRDRARDRGGRDRVRERDRNRERERDGDENRPDKNREYRDYRDRDSNRARRRSRSKSPVRRGGERDRRDYGRDKYDDRRDKDRDRDKDRNRERERERERDRDRLAEHRDRERPKDDKPRGGTPSTTAIPARSGPSQIILDGPSPSPGASNGATKRPNLDPDYEPHEREEGEELEDNEGDAMDAENDDEAAMKVLMGFGGFNSTKGKPVLGNEEGSVEIKKMRTWRQYMNRRGGFNRPLDKIK